MSEHIEGFPCSVLAAAATDIGRVRSTNEDAYVIAAIGQHDAISTVAATEETSFDTTARPVLLAVSDGMGGHEAGEVASALVVESLRRFLPQESADWDQTLHAAVERANSEVWNAAQRPSKLGMGATLTAVCIHGYDAHVAEVGDSRAYLLRNHELQLLTRDQSYVQMLLDAGALTPDEAAQSPMRNIILQAMGQKPEIRVDIGRVRLLGGDTVLVCCDGLSNEVQHERIRDLLIATPSPKQACASLIRSANDHGGRDNITVIIAKIL